MLVAWLPVEEADLTVGPVICTEPAVALVSPDHELAEEDSVSIEIFGDYGVPRAPLSPDYWVDAFTPFHTPSGRTVERHDPTFGSLDDIFTNVSAGGLVHNLGAHVARYSARPDVVYLAIRDWGLRWALVWRDGGETGLIRALADVVRDLGTAALH